ncbi:unnamed protein product, partial [Oppiella nova]
MGIGFIGALVASMSWPSLNILFGSIVDVFVNYESGKRETNNTNAMTASEFMNEIYTLSTIQFGAWILITLANFIVMTLFPLAALNQIHTIKIKYFQSVLKQEISWFDSKSSGDFASRVSADLKRVEDGLNEKLGLAIQTVCAVVLNLIFAFSYGWKLTLVVLAIAPFTAVATGVMNKVQASFARKEMDSYASAGNMAEEVISSVRTVYAFGGEAKEVDRYETNLVPAMRSGIKRNFITGLGNGVLYSTLYLGMALGIWFGVKLIIESMDENSNEYTIGKVTIIFWSVLSAGYNIGAAAPHFEAINMARGTAAMIFDIIERKPKIDISSEIGKIPQSLTADIEFKDINFSYPMRQEVPILETFNLKIKAGETVALVGPSGCGKSTLIQLIQRFYDPLSGSILIDGHDIKDLNLGWLREQIGVVGQEPVLFDTSIKENISLGSHTGNVTQKDIEVAAIESNAHEFISKLPDNYSTYVGDRGAQLSGGQKQRIAIARALINRPKILLLDEATSALDMQSEALVQTALDKASKGRTTIIVAHRLSTIVNSDRIIFIENGRVLEMGTHRELMDKKGLIENIKQHHLDDVDLDPMSYKRTISVMSSSANSALNSIVNDNKESEEEEIKDFPQTRLLKMLAVDKYYIFCGLFCSVLYGLVVPLYSYLFGLLVAVFAEETNVDTIWDKSISYALYYVAIAVGVGIVSVTQITMLGIAGERLTMRLRKMAFAAILRQEIG